MASKGSVVLRGRFPKGTIVKLVRVDGPHVLRAPAGADGETQTVKEKDGVSVVEFSAEVGARYLVTGQVDGFPLEVRATGREKGEESSVTFQAPIQPDRQRLSDGSWLDEAPTKESPPKTEVAPGPRQSQIPKNVQQRSATPRGEGHPVDPKEQTPIRRQEDVKDNVKQMSDTETGEAAELVVGPQRQEDVPKSVQQRSSTPTGVATVIPGGNAVEVQQQKESSEGKEKRGEPGRVAAEPIDNAKPVRGASQKQSEKRQQATLDRVAEAQEEAGVETIGTPASPDGVEDQSGRDAQGQPADPAVARAAGIEPAKKPSEPVRTRKSSKRK